MYKNKIQKMVLCAFFTALTAVLSQIAIPIGPVPVNLATFAVFCAGALLGTRYGTCSLVIYTILGMVGVPVFAMFRGGLGVLAGPTGGYIVGYIPAAFLVGLISEKINKHHKILLYSIAMVAGMLTCFLLGTAWFMFSTNTGLWSALTICVIPFIPGDIVKIISASVLSRILHPVLQRYNSKAQ